jgi:hypothetical protein
LPRVSLITAAFAFVCFVAMWSMIQIAVPLLWLGVAFLLVSVVTLLVAKHRSRYDLGDLRVLHESGGPPLPDELPEVADDAGVVCPCCGNIYAAWMLVCPHCKR